MSIKINNSHYTLIQYQDKYQIIILQENEFYLVAVTVKYQIYFLHVLNDFVLAYVQLA